MKTPPARSGNDKHGFSQIRLRGHKDFKVALYNTIRLSAFYHGKKLSRKFSTRKMMNENGTTIIRVYREK